MIQIELPLENMVRKAEENTRENPTIFFLHGFGSNMQDLFGLVQFFGKEWNCISLQASIPTQYNGWAWAELDYNNISRLPKPEQMRNHYQQVLNSIDNSIDLLNLDNKRINLLGFSQGASLALYCGLKDPNRFRSVISLCGFLPIEQLITEIDIEQAKNLNVFMGNGRLDSIIPIDLAHKSRDSIRSLDSDISYNEYDANHTISEDCLRDFLDWLKEKNQK